MKIPLDRFYLSMPGYARRVSVSESLMLTRDRISISNEELTAFCTRYHIPESSLFVLARSQREPVQRLGRNIDLVPKRGLNQMIRDDVLASSEVNYAT